MDYEKKYKEALEKAHKLCAYPISKPFISDLQDLFPELKESEDEKIRKEIINYFECQSRDEPTRKDIHNKWIAWLEKQGEQNLANSAKTCKVEQKPADNEMIEILRTEYEKGRADAIAEMQNPAWSEEDERIKKCIINFLRLESSRQNIDADWFPWLKSIKDRVQPQNLIITDDELAQAKKEAYNEALDKIEYHSGELTFDDGWSAAIWYFKKRNMQPQPKQEWKQENTGDLTDFENAMMHIGASFFGQHAGLDPNDTNAIKEQANLLLELIPKKEWSEEDENRFNNLIFLVEHSDENKATKEGFIKFINKLKSLRPQTTWKPNKEQMVTLEYYMHTLVCDSYKETLFGLYQDLKKLREE